MPRFARTFFLSRTLPENRFPLFLGALPMHGYDSRFRHNGGAKLQRASHVHGFFSTNRGFKTVSERKRPLEPALGYLSPETERRHPRGEEVARPRSVRCVAAPTRINAMKPQWLQFGLRPVARVHRRPESNPLVRRDCLVLSDSCLDILKALGNVHVSFCRDRVNLS